VPVHVSQPAFVPQQQQQQQQQHTPHHQTTPPTSVSPPQQALQQQPQQQQQQQQQAPQVSPQQQPQALPPVKITLDEADKDFVQLLNNAPRALMPEQAALLQRGEVFLAYFPNEPEDSSASPGSSGSGSASASVSPPSTSVTKLCLFLEPAYHPSVEEALELGVPPHAPVSLLCWCEPHVARYVKTDQAVAVEQVGALHLGATHLFPRQAVRSNCFSIVTQHVQLHLEADASSKRRDWFLALYTLVSQAPAVPSSASSMSSSSSSASFSTSPPQHPVHQTTSHIQSQGQEGFGGGQQTGINRQQQQQQQHEHNSVSAAQQQQQQQAHGVSAADEDAAVSRARALLEGGMPFVVFVLDKHDSELTTRHEVVLWYRPPQAGGVPHSLCWCRRGPTLDFSPARSLPLNRTVQICMGKQTKALKNAAAHSADPAAAFSVMVEKMILNLCAPSADERARWLSAFHMVMSAAGKKRVFEAETEQQQQQQQQQHTAQQQHAPQQ